MRPDDVVGYTYNADNYHSKCVIYKMIRRGELSPGALDLTPETALDQHAGANAIDREDEASFDSDDFPKVLFRDMLEGEEFCGWCEEPLNE